MTNVNYDKFNVSAILAMLRNSFRIWLLNIKATNIISSIIMNVLLPNFLFTW